MLLKVATVWKTRHKSRRRLKDKELVKKLVGYNKNCAYIVRSYIKHEVTEFQRALFEKKMSF